MKRVKAGFEEGGEKTGIFGFNRLNCMIFTYYCGAGCGGGGG